MSRRLTRIWLLPLLLIGGQAWALGLGEIRLSSALNEPLRAEIELLAATPEELNNLQVQLASAETFERYGLDRPLYLAQMNFEIYKTGTTQGNVVRITSTAPMTEPFVTFLVEAIWSRGRLLREYTVLLDPPTFAPPPTTQTQTPVQAPSRPEQSDAGQIERTPPPPPPTRPDPAPQSQPPTRTTEAPRSTTPAEPAPSSSAPAPSASLPPPPPEAGFDTVSGDIVNVQRGDTLWRIAERVRPDSRLTMNQTMLAIYEANPEAFGGNANLLNAGAVLRIPSADDIYRISRGDALAEMQRQHNAWEGGVSTPVDPAPSVVDTTPEPSLELVPPDEEQSEYVDPTTADPSTGYSRELEIEERIAALEADVPEQESLIEIRNNELAQLRQELAELRGEEYVEPVEEPAIEEPVDESIADDDEIFVDDDESLVADEDAAADEEVADEEATAPPVVAAAQPKPSLVDTIMGYVFSLWGLIAAVVIIVLGALVWFARRAASEDDESGVWEALDADDIDAESLASTERLSALAQEDDTAIVVVEKESKAAMAAEMRADSETAEVPAFEEESDPLATTGSNETLEDTFSSETAINLDQSDPIAEADFHMAYGLHDQAADLINGALEVEPEREDLLAKLCEVYFVWGNRDGFVDAANRMKTVVGDASSAEWDKIVIMGQQIAADNELFSGKTAAEATKAVDLSFDGATEDSDLDIDFAGGPDGEVSDVIDLGAETGETAAPSADASSIDFAFDEEPDIGASVTQEMPSANDETVDHELVEETAEQPMAEEPAEEAPASDSSVETPTIEQQFASLDVTGEVAALSEDDADTEVVSEDEAVLGDDEATKLASLDDMDDTEAAPLDDAAEQQEQTAEIDLDDLGLDLDALGDADLAADVGGEDIDLDLDATGEAEVLGDLDVTGTNEALAADDSADATGINEAIDLDALEATGLNEVLDEDSDLGATGEIKALDETDAADATGMHAVNIEDALAETNEMDISSDDETGQNPALVEEEPEPAVSTTLLDATGQTQVLSDDLAVETLSDVDSLIADSDATMMAPGYGDEDAVASLPDDAETLLAPLDDDDDDEGEFDFAKTEALPKDVFTGEASADETGELPAITGGTDVDLDLDDLTAALKVSEVGDTINQPLDDATVEQPRFQPAAAGLDLDVGDLEEAEDVVTQALSPGDVPADLHDARTMTEVGTKLDLARAYVDMGDPGGARSILEEVLDEGDDGQRQQAQQLLDSLPS